ncbi:hypothetical protein WOLCODRAFT_26219 [Wolfiporia cocos MD-104 SS10]|uniref:Secreted protein n=1 Tax=Wolfiporia cocos (strain MD-104) TaxID=742152 RepID=A0A2H3JNQ9_WOLCO|nr:hypothetical protein WOLCODRAFT_26219 [Wolfiporia cocos MD-104 SS10]
MMLPDCSKSFSNISSNNTGLLLFLILSEATPSALASCAVQCNWYRAAHDCAAHRTRSLSDDERSYNPMSQ